MKKILLLLQAFLCSLVLYSWFHIKGSWSVHSFDWDYLSIPIALRYLREPFSWYPRYLRRKSRSRCQLFFSFTTNIVSNNVKNWCYKIIFTYSYNLLCKIYLQWFSKDIRYWRKYKEKLWTSWSAFQANRNSRKKKLELK